MNQKNEMNSVFIDAIYKDSSPENTISTIKKILFQNNLKTQETWVESQVPYCYTVHINVTGTTFTVTGKGLSREFALASGYGELMERLQMGYIGNLEAQKGGNYDNYDPQDEVINAKTLLVENYSWYNTCSHRLFQFTGKHIDPENIVMQFTDENGKLLATPFYNITKDKKSYIPSIIRKRVYTSNGCAAGNSPEEALVQAISEVTERNHQLRILDEEITPPDIPDETLRKYTVAYKIIEYVRSKGYHVIVKDCSLGTKFPVIAVCYINQKTGKYHTHFGAYPIFEIALERALTESFQGRNIDNIANFTDFAYKKDVLYNIGSISTELAKGCSEKLPSFFIGTHKYPYHQSIGFSGKNNKELLKECIEYFREYGYEVLARDCSSLGFPTYQVIIPGYSEHCIYRLDKKQDSHRYFNYAISALRNPSNAKLDDYIGLIKHMKVMQQFPSYINRTHGFLAGSNLSAELTRQEDMTLLSLTLAYIYFEMGDYKNSLQQISNALTFAQLSNNELLICIKRYLSLLINGYSTIDAKQIIELFHSQETTNRLFSILAAKKNPLHAFTLKCDLNCNNDCILIDKCCQINSDSLIALIQTGAKKNTYISSQKNILKALQE